jgi:hypothetical protein
MAQYLTTETLRVIRMLRTAFSVPFVVMTVKDTTLEAHHGEPAHGDCKNMGDHWRIRLARGNSESEMLDSVIHEFAHAADEYENGPATDPHRKSWGHWYSVAHKTVRG